MKFPVLWSGLVSRVGASHRVNLVHLSPLDRNAQEKLLCLVYAQLIELKNVTRLCPSHVTRLDQSRAIEIFHWLIIVNPTKSGPKWREKKETISSRPCCNLSSGLLNLKYENYFFCTVIDTSIFTCTSWKRIKGSDNCLRQEEMSKPSE